jgi:hypothetical protein
MVILKANYKLNLSPSGVINTVGWAGTKGTAGQQGGDTNRGDGGAGGTPYSGSPDGGFALGGPQLGTYSSAPTVNYAPAGGNGGTGGAGSGGGILIQAPVFDWGGVLDLRGGSAEANAGSLEINTGLNGQATRGFKLQEERDLLAKLTKRG